MKTRELEGAALDWAVAKVDGRGEVIQAAIARFGGGHGMFPGYYIDWRMGGPLIEAHHIELHTNTGDQHDEHERWYAVCPTEGGGRGAMGPTPLVAAMRALVFAQLGDEIDLPDELQ